MKKIFVQVFAILFLLLNSNIVSAACNPTVDICAATQGPGWSCINTDAMVDDTTYNAVSCLCPGGANVECIEESSIVVPASSSGPSSQNKINASGGGNITVLGQPVDINSLNGLVQLLIIAANWILGISGSITLAMFVYAGFMLIISAGSSERVTKAKEIIKGTVIGLLIIFASYTVIGFAIHTMGIEDTNWASSKWFEDGSTIKQSSNSSGTSGNLQNSSVVGTPADNSSPTLTLEECVNKFCSQFKNPSDAFTLCSSSCLNSYGNASDKESQNQMQGPTSNDPTVCAETCQNIYFNCIDEYNPDTNPTPGPACMTNYENCLNQKCKSQL